jgi:hypothetical protein
MIPVKLAGGNVNRDQGFGESGGRLQFTMGRLSKEQGPPLEAGGVNSSVVRTSEAAGGKEAGGCWPY